jgi:hypothetical protein
MMKQFLCSLDMTQYIFSLLLCVAKNRDLYESNSKIHNINTRCSSDLHTPIANLTTFKKVLFILKSQFLITFLLA